MFLASSHNVIFELLDIITQTFLTITTDLKHFRGFWTELLTDYVKYYMEVWLLTKVQGHLRTKLDSILRLKCKYLSKQEINFFPWFLVTQK